MRRRSLLKSLAGLGLAVAVVAALISWHAQASSRVALSAASTSATSQFHGVNWADPNDNFTTGDLIPVGLADTDSYSTTYSKATSILKGFQALGANTVRMPFNHATATGTWWNGYTGAIDAALALGMKVVIAPWLQNGVTGSTFYQDWNVVVSKYNSNGSVYFDIMNEPWGYSAAAEDNVAAAWVANYPQVSRGRIIVPGAYSDQNLCTVGADSRLSGTLLSIHDYTLGGETHSTAAAWVTSFENNICGYDSRAVLTEFGVPMNTGVNYDGARDGTNDVSYLYALTDTVRSQGMGSILWAGLKFSAQSQGPGPCENASCAITSLQGTAPNYTLSVNNRSGLDRLQYGWGTSTTTSPPPITNGAARELAGAGSGRCLDVPSQSQADGALLQIWDCNGGANQKWTHLSSGELQVYGSKCLDVPNQSASQGAKLQIWDCNGGTNQQWSITSAGTLVGAGSGLCLDVTGQATANGAPLQIWGCNGGSNQQWKQQ